MNNKTNIDSLISKIESNPLEASRQKPQDVGFLGTAIDVAKAPLTGAAHAFEEMGQTAYDIVNFADNSLGIDALDDEFNLDLTDEMWETKTTAGGMVAAISQFLTGFATAGAALKGLGVAAKVAKGGKAAKYAYEAGKGAIADFSVFDPQEERFSNLLVNVPALGSVADYLAYEDGDDKLEGRMKNAVEGLALGGVSDALFHYVKGLKAAKVAGNKEAAAAVMQETQEKVAKALDGGAAIKGTKEAVEEGTEKGTKKAAKEAADKAATETVQEVPQSQALADLGMDATDELRAEESLHGLYRDPMLNPDEVIEDFNKALDEGRVAKEYERTDALNTKHMNTAGEEGKLAYEAVDKAKSRQMVDPAVKSPRSWATAKERAYNMTAKLCESDPEDWSKRMESFAKQVEHADEFMVSITSMAEQMNDTFVDLCRDWTVAKEVDPSKAEVLKTKLDDVLRKHSAIVGHIERIRTGLGRGLNISKMDKDRLFKLDKELFDRSGKMVYTEQELEQLARRVLASDLDAATVGKLLIPNTKTGKFWALHNEYWINSILSGVTTHGVNVFSNGLKAAVLMPLDKIAGGWGGFDGGLFNISNPELFKEGCRAWAGLRHSVKDALDMAVRSFKANEGILTITSKVEIPERMWSAEAMGKESVGHWKLFDEFGKILNLPSRFLLAEDEFFKQLVYRQRVYTKLYATAEKRIANKTLQNTPDAIKKFIEDNFDAAFTKRTLRDGTEVGQGKAIFKEALEEAEEATFTKRHGRDTITGQLSNFVNKHPWMRPVIPFIRTPMNILKDIGQHTPGIAHHMREYKEAIKKGGRSAAIARGRLYTGSMMYTAMTMLAMQGIVTGDGPQNPAARKLLYETGWQPNSLKVAGRYISLGRLDPFGSYLSLSANFAEVSQFLNDDERDHIAGALLTSLAKNLSSKTYLRGLTEVLQVATGDYKSGRIIENRLLSYIPFVFQNARKSTDPTLRECQTLVEKVMARIPGFSHTQPPAYSWVTGQPILYGGGIASGMSPVFWSKDKNNKVIEEMANFNKSFGAPRDQVDGVKLDNDQYAEYKRLHGSLKISGKTMMEALEDLMESDTYDINREKYPDSPDDLTGKRQTMVRKVIQRYRRQAKRELLKTNNELYEKVKIAKRNKRLANQGKYNEIINL